MAFFSMIIPCHNSSKTIERLLDSLTKQGIEKEDLEVIIVDDNSTDNFLDLVHNYDEKLNIIKVKTDTDIHCPSNSRKEGMKYVSGEWICFCDHDDFYEDNALKKVKEWLQNNDEKYCLCTILRSWNEEKNTFMEYKHKQAWLHGKFYNRENLIEEYGINFKKDLVTHEDIYFNSCVLSVLYLLGKLDFTYYDIYTYRWVEEPTSITRAYSNERGYLHDNFNDYIVSASYPFLIYAKASALHLNQVMMTLLHAYFYYEAFSYNFGAEKIKDNFYAIRNFIKLIKIELNITNTEIIDFVYLDPEKYKMVRDDCMIAEGYFIEKTSFKDFINYLGKD